MSRRVRAPVMRCVYCGAPAFGHTCYGHRDLLRIDPYYVMSTSRGPFVGARKVDAGEWARPAE